VTDELLSYALLAGEVVDAVLGTPPRAPVAVHLVGVGTPPVPRDGMSARTYRPDGFVVVADARTIAVDDPASSGPSPKHLAGAFDLHFVLSARGYADLAQVVHCNHDAVPMRPPAYALVPQPFALRGRVTQGGLTPTPFAGASVAIAATALATTTDADGTYVFVSVPAAATVTVVANGTPRTVPTSYPDPVLTVNFAF